MATDSAGDLVVYCLPSNFVQSPSPAALFTSSDGGMTFTKLSSLPPEGWDIAASEPGVFFFLANSGVIVASFDNGVSWNTVASLSTTNRNGQSSLGGLRFITTQSGWALTPSGELLLTTDGGHSWASTTFAS